MTIRSQIENRSRFTDTPRGREVRKFVWVCFLSAAAHLLFFGGAFLLYDFEFTPPKPRVVRVDLVSFAPGPVQGEAVPAPAPVPEPEKTETVSLDAKPVAPPEKVAKPAPVPVIKPDISLKSKPKNIKDLMAARKKKPEKKPKPPEKKREKTRKTPAKKAENQSQQQIDQALKRMQAAIDSQKKAPAKGPGGEQGQGAGSGTQGASPLTLYQMVLKSAIEQNWVFNEIMAGMNQNLEVKVFVKILKSGEIRDISYETRSGNQYLDESAKKAIRRASPLPELPKGMSSYELVVGFTPRGLR